MKELSTTISPINLDDFGHIRDSVFTTLRAAILDGKIKPGERVVERNIAEQLGISRTPVREAIRKLEIERLVTHIPRKGVVVVGFSKEDVLEIMAIRTVLEGLICRFAAEKIQEKDLNRMALLLEQMAKEYEQGNNKKVNQLHDKFHQMIYKAAKSPRIFDLLNTLKEYISKFASVAYTKPGRTLEAMDEHRLILAALRERNALKAEALAISHVENSNKAYLDIVGPRAVD